MFIVNVTLFIVSCLCLHTVASSAQDVAAGGGRQGLAAEGAAAWMFLQDVPVETRHGACAVQAGGLTCSVVKEATQTIYRGFVKMPQR